MRPLASLFLLAIGASACATVEVRRTSDATYKDGVRFYRPDVYLLVTNVDGKLQTTVVSLPNKAEEYVIRSRSGLGSVSVQATLAGGWNLTELGTTVDTKIPDTISALGSMLSAMKHEAKAQELEPGLWRIEFDAQGHVSNLKRVTISP